MKRVGGNQKLNGGMARISGKINTLKIGEAFIDLALIAGH